MPTFHIHWKLILQYLILRISDPKSHACPLPYYIGIEQKIADAAMICVLSTIPQKSNYRFYILLVADYHKTTSC